LKNSKVVSFLSPFKVGQAGNLWTLPRNCERNIVHLVGFSNIVSEFFSVWPAVGHTPDFRLPLHGYVDVHARSVFVCYAWKAVTARFPNSRQPAQHDHYMERDAGLVTESVLLSPV